MPPKKGGGDKVSKKTENKKKEKVIEDKTFGLKNKKGGKNQKYIAQVEKQVKSGGDPKSRRMEEMRLAEKKKKEEEKKKQEEERLLMAKPIITQKIAQGVDPKSVFCAFFKQGLCKKGDKCKFSHDPACERKAAKRNIYTDARDEEDKMEDWDEAKLNEVVNKKHGGEASNKTDIICKHFLDALENNKYGWFWTCPVGGNDCKYRHALPPGFVLKKDKKREEKSDGISIEELIEQKRAELSAQPNLTPVTLETFVKWKKRKLREKAENEKKEADKKKDKAKAGITLGLSGREMFSFNPTMAGDEDDDEEGEAFNMADRENDDDDDGVKVHEIKFDEFGIMEDGTAVLESSSTAQHSKLRNGGGAADDDQKPSSSATAAAASTSSAATAGGAAAAAIDDAIDEDLFNDEDLDELEEDLENLDVC